MGSLDVLNCFYLCLQPIVNAEEEESQSLFAEEVEDEDAELMEDILSTIGR
jgi:CRISPR/Cas system-associated protein Cas7 (RAMP superfamily)